MPIVVPPQIPQQINPSGVAPYTQQYNFGQAIGNVSSWNPQCSIPQIQNFLNDGIREWCGRRNWYGMMTRGQIPTAGIYNAGTVNLTIGSSSVQGIGTNWTQTLNGLPITQQSLRVGYYAPVYNIIALDPVAQVLTLDLPWGNPSITTGYYITSLYYTFPNVKRLFSCRNLQLYYRINTNYPQSFIENFDPSRLIVMFPRLLATMPPDPNGNYQVEMWPASNIATVYPWLGYLQTPQLVNDLDNFPAWSRVDAIISYATSQALMWRPKDNPHYSESTAMVLAQQKQKEWEMRVSTAMTEDEGLYRQDVIMREEMDLPLIDPASGSYMMGGDTLRAMTAWSDY